MKQKSVYPDVTSTEVQDSLLFPTIDSLDACLYIVNINLEIEVLNKAQKKFNELIGIKYDVTGKTLKEVYPSFFKKPNKEEFEYIFQKGKEIVRDDLTKLTDKELIIEIKKFPVFYKGKVTKVITKITDISEKKKTEIALEKTLDKYRMLTENMTDNIWIFDLPTFHFNYLSPSIKNISGFTPEEVIDRHVKKLITSKSIVLVKEIIMEELARDNIQGVDPDRSRTVELEMHHKKGHTVWIEVNAKFLRDKSGLPVNILGITRDITDRKETELILNESELKHSAIVEQSVDGIMLINEEGTILEWNTGLKNMTGITRARALNKPFWDILSLIIPFQGKVNVTVNFIKEGFLKALKEKNLSWYNQVREDYIHTIKGKPLIVQQITLPIKTKKGWLFSTIIRDITARKTAEEQTIKNEKLFRALTENSSDLVIIMDKDYSLIYSSPSCIILGYKSEELVSLKPKDFIHPEDFSSVIQHLKKSLNHPNEAVWLSSFRLRKKDGTWLYLDGILTNMLNVVGVNGIVVNCRNVTDLILAENAKKEADKILLKSQQKLSLHIEQTPLGVIEWDNDFKVTSWNPAAEEIFGYSTREAMGKHPADMILPDNVKHHVDEVWANLLSQKGGKRSTNENIRKDGTIILCEWYNTPLIDKNDTVIGVASLVMDITERTKATEALQLSEQRFRELADLLPQMIAEIDLNANIIYANQYAFKITGYTNDDLNKGMNVMQLILPEERDLVAQNLKKLITDKKHEGNEYNLLRKDGSIFPVLVYTGLIVRNNKPAGFRVILTDITQLKLAEASMKKALETTQKIVEGMPFGVLIVSQNNKILRANKSALHMMNAKRKEVIGKVVHDIIHSIISGKSPIIDPGKKAGSSENILLRPDGQQIPILKTTIPISLEGKDVLLVTFIDITDLNNAQKELIQAKEKAQESDRLKSAFLANMSHEIRTPMNGIIGFAELLKNQKLPVKKRDDFINIINNSGKHLLYLINDIIDISKIEAGQLNIEKTECTINNLFSELYSFFQNYLAEKNKEEVDLFMNKSLDDNESCIYTDSTRLRQILTNLLSNASKFTDSGQIIFSYKLKDDQTLEFYVKDSGIGIPKDKQDFVFDRFRQVDESNYGSYDGTGLGLCISKAIVELLGGRIWLESDEHVGSTFYFTIPYKPVKKITVIEKDNKNQEINFTKLKNKTVLIVEDDDIAFLHLKEVLSSFGINQTRATDGYEAIEICKSNPEIDLVLMDIQLPRLKGYLAAREVKKIKNNLPIIAQTAYASSEEKEKCFKFGCDAYITKPIDNKNLIHIINTYIDKK